MLVGTTNLNTTLNLTYVLTDVVETLLYDLRSEMGKQGYELRHDAKRNFNTAISAIRRLKQDVDKTQLSTQENFGNDSDCLLAFIKLLIDRCGDDERRCLSFIIISNGIRLNSAWNCLMKSVYSRIFSRINNHQNNTIWRYLILF